VGELPLPVQAQLLRVLQEGEVRRVGANRPRRVNVRLIAATHRDLPRMVAEGKFREDLYFRLRVFEVRLPPLRERCEDLPDLARHLLEKACRRLNRPALELSAEAISAIQSHPWPGNVRELENALERAVILCEGSEVTADGLALEVPSMAAAPAAGAGVWMGAPGAAAGGGAPLDASLEEYFRRFVLEHQERLSETEIARRLGISRKALWERRQRLGLHRTH
jgi:DNA-binding NtrC family response regulator